MFSQYGPNKLVQYGFYYIGFPACCFLVRLKLVYVQAVGEKEQESNNSDMTV